MGEANNFKFGIRIDLSKSHLMVEKYPYRGRGKGLGPFFKFWDPSMNLERVKLDTSDLVQRLAISITIRWMINSQISRKEVWLRDHFLK